MYVCMYVWGLRFHLEPCASAAAKQHHKALSRCLRVSRLIIAFDGVVSVGLPEHLAMVGVTNAKIRSVKSRNREALNPEPEKEF